MHRYKNTSQYRQSLAGVGEFDAGEEFDTTQIIENPNFKYIGEATDTEPQTATVSDATQKESE